MNMSALNILMKPASSLCNMQCDYCFYCDEAEKREQVSYGLMTEETLEAVIRKGIRRAEGMISFAYQGGEPTLRGLDFFRKAVKLQKEYNTKGLRIHNAFQTNGLLIDEEWCAFFKENQFLVGVSVDGLPEIHDRYRHRKNGNSEQAAKMVCNREIDVQVQEQHGSRTTYDRVFQTTQLLDCYGVDYNILTVVTADVAERIEEVYRHYRKMGWNYQQYIVCLDPFGGAKGQMSYSMTAECYGRFLIRLFDLWYEDAKHGKAPYIRQFENYIGILMGYAPEACDQRGCCGLQYVVEADGRTYPCDFYAMDEYLLGNIRTDSIRKLDGQRETMGFLERSSRISQECPECPYYRLCRGGCQRNRELAEDGLYRNQLCEGYRMFFAACEERMKELAAAYKM